MRAAWLASATRLSGAEPHRATLLACAACGLVAIAIYRGLGETLELGAAPRPTLSPKSRAIVVRISSLFALDSLAGGFLTTAMLSYFFFERFGMSEANVKVTAHRMRSRWRDLLREEIGRTVDTSSAIEAEMRDLMAALTD